MAIKKPDPSRIWIMALLILSLLSLNSDRAATPGLPFTEDFSDTALRDDPLTDANWSTEEQGLYLSWRDKRFGAFGADAAMSYFTDGTGTNQSLALGDVDGDGDLDLVEGDQAVNHLYLNNGTSDPWNGATKIAITSDSHDTRSVVLGDVDQDGDLDLVAGNDQTQTNRLYLNNGTTDPWNGVTGIDITADAHNSKSVALADVDDDGDLDLVAGNSTQTNRLYLNNGTADPWNGVSGVDITADVHDTRSVVLTDVDEDGDLDLVAGNSTQTNRLYLNNGTTDPWNGVSGTDITSDTHDTRSVVLGDVDGDGDLDLVAGNYSETNRVYLNNGTADPWNGVAGSEIFLNVFYTTSAVLGDIDGDGDLDLMFGNFLLDDVLFLNNGTADPWLGVPPTLVSEFSDDTESLALGDVDGDGDLDLVQGLLGFFNSYLLNDGTTNPWNGVAGDTIDGTLFSHIGSVALGDVDGDGDLDLVTAESGSNRLYLNNGTANPWSGVTGSDITADSYQTFSVALGDVDGDGDLDFVAGNYTVNRLYLNNGTSDPWNGVSGTDITADSQWTLTVALDDVDDDGDLDLVAGNDSGPNRLYLNNGTADPWNGVSGIDITADAHDTLWVALGDVDGDGDLDLVAGNYSQTNRLYLNNGTADPWNGVTGADITSDAARTKIVLLGDVDRDGDLDLVAGNRSDRNRLYLNNGTSDPWNGVTGSDIGTLFDGTESVALGDVDGDGDLDLVDGNEYTEGRLYLNNGTADPWGGVAGVAIDTDPYSTVAVVLADVDGDGDLDLVEGNNDLASRLFLNVSTPDPWNPISGSAVTADLGGTQSVALGDVDRDGDVDLVAGNNGRNRLYLNNGTLKPWEGVTGLDITTDAEFTYAVALADVDGDGDLDLVAGNSTGQPNRLYLNDGSGDPWDTLSSGDSIPEAGDFLTISVAIGDVDGDGDLDVVAGNIGVNRLYRNDGNSPPGWTGHDITADVRNTWAVALGDIDGDSDLDLAVGNENQDNQVYLNDGAALPSWTSQALPDGGSLYATRAIVLADIDRDADLDVIAGNDGQVNRLYWNDGSSPPGWTGEDLSTETDSTRALAVVDWEGDGDWDLVVGNQGQPNRLYLQDPSDIVLDITADSDSTQAIAAGDVNGDGLADIVAGNLNQQNRLYRRILYHTALGRATSLDVDGATSVVTNATLTATGVLLPNSAVDFYLSNNGGARWFLVTPGEQFVFSTSGNDLRWRAELHSASPALTPAIDQVQIDSAFLPSTVGDRVWLDLDADGIQDPSENGLNNIVVALYDSAGFVVDIDITDPSGDYSFPDVTWNVDYSLRFITPTGYALSPADQGADDDADSDPDAITGYTPLFRLNAFEDHTDWDAGMVLICTPPDEAIYLYVVTLSTDGNDYPILHFMDPNQPGQVTGYNIYRSHDTALPINQWTLEGSDVIDMDEGTPNQQWVDSSGDVSPTDVWFYQVTAYNNGCPVEIAEGPF